MPRLIWSPSTVLIHCGLAFLILCLHLFGRSFCPKWLPRLSGPILTHVMRGQFGCRRFTLVFCGKHECGTAHFSAVNGELSFTILASPTNNIFFYDCTSKDCSPTFRKWHPGLAGSEFTDFLILQFSSWSSFTCHQTLPKYMIYHTNLYQSSDGIAP